MARRQVLATPGGPFAANQKLILVLEAERRILFNTLEIRWPTICPVLF